MNPTQPVPRVGRDDVVRIVDRDFPAAQLETVLSILDDYRARDSDPSRVQLAALKLAAGDIDRLRAVIEKAGQDFRDVVAAAEYPGYLRTQDVAALSAEQKRTLIDADWRQYLNWLNRQ